MVVKAQQQQEKVRCFTRKYVMKFPVWFYKLCRIQTSSNIIQPFSNNKITILNPLLGVE